MVGRFSNFSFTNTKRLVVLLLGLGGTICCLHFWYFEMCLEENGLEPKILQIMNMSHQLSYMVRVLLMYGLYQ